MAKKRGAGEGSIHVRRDGRWCASIDLGFRNGKRHRKHILGATRGAVADKLNEELGKLRKGLNIAPEKQTVAQFLERFRAVLRRRRVFDFDGEVAGLSRVEQAVAFLALLELRKSGEVALAQAAPFAPIRVSRPEHERIPQWTVRSA